MSIPFFSRGSFPEGKRIIIYFLWPDSFLHLLFISIGVATELNILNDNVITWPYDAVEYPVKHAQNTESTYQ